MSTGESNRSESIWTGRIRLGEQVCVSSTGKTIGRRFDGEGWSGWSTLMRSRDKSVTRQVASIKGLPQPSPRQSVFLSGTNRCGRMINARVVNTVSSEDKGRLARAILGVNALANNAGCPGNAPERTSSAKRASHDLSRDKARGLNRKCEWLDIARFESWATWRREREREKQRESRRKKKRSKALYVVARKIFHKDAYLPLCAGGIAD